MAWSTKSGVHDRSVAVVLCAFLAMIYLLTFCGQFRSIDEFAMYARTESLAQGNELEIPQLQFTSHHNRVGNFEPGQSLLAVPLYLIAQQIPSASNIAAVMLFNVFITALTGGMLYLLLRRLSFSQAIAVGTVLAWGLGTMAWPYARSFFREPLNGLVWVAAALCCVTFSQTNRSLYAVACIAVLCIGITVKASSAAAVPVFLITFLWDSNKQRVTLRLKRLILLALAALATYAIGMQLDSSGLARKIPNLADYTWNYPIQDALLRAYGALISPVKGLAFYSPVILATFIGWPRLAKRHGLAAFLTIGVTLSLLYIYGDISYWHGGMVVWGPRYHVPLLPLLLIPYAAALSIRSWVAKIWVVVWSIAGLVVQFAVGTASWSDAVLQMVTAYAKEVLIGLNGLPWYSWKLITCSPALVQVLNWQPKQLDMVWLRALSNGTLATDKYLAALLVTSTVLALVALIIVLTRCRLARRYTRWIAVSCVLLALAGTAGLLVRSARNSNDYAGLERADARRLAQVMNSNQEPYSLVFVSNEFFTNYWLGLLKGQFVTQWYSPLDKTGLASILTHAPSAHKIWLVIDRAHMPPDAKPYLARQLLALQAYEIGGQWVGDYELFEYALLELMEHVPLQRTWVAGIQINSLATDTRQLHPGGVLRLDLTFSTLEPLQQNYALFVHLAPAEGPVISGRDGEPQYGGAPTSKWKVQKTAILDRRGIRIPEDAKPGVYKIVCGWLDAEGVRLAPTVGQGPTADGGIVLGTIEVLADDVN
ncbi:MAG: hypothetical protein ACYCZF_07465 [Anaerolineae bacterium]